MVKKLSPKEVESRVLPLGRVCLDWRMEMDASTTTERLDVTFRGIEDMVKSCGAECRVG